eukprot:11495902-Ditylum_brightwellii.AAC.1
MGNKTSMTDDDDDDDFIIMLSIWWRMLTKREKSLQQYNCSGQTCTRGPVWVLGVIFGLTSSPMD